MPVSVEELAEALGADAAGNLAIEVLGPAEPSMAGPEHIALAMEPSFLKSVSQGSARAAIVWPEADWRSMGLEAVIFAPRSRYVLAGVNRFFDRPVHAPEGVHPTAVVDGTARLGPGASVGPFVVVEPGAVIGARARILSHVTIGQGARIGDDALLHAGVRIGARVKIGDRFIAQPNAVIGADGFSFVTPKPGAVEEVRRTGAITEASRTEGFVRINSLGAVRIGDDVEIGANSAIDRGTVADTVIGTGTKIDNLVQIGHNVVVGDYCLLCGQVGIAGSVVIGDRVVLAGQVGIADHLRVGSDVVIAAQSGVASDVPPNRVMLGSPAIKMELALESYKAYRRLPRLMATVQALQKRLSKSGAKD
ncbi:MAG: UDP-3-O-(3-hydroxymyristoyl)glucosamine N-acyltransferase [Paracoccaceae bacterium]